MGLPMVGQEKKFITRCFILQFKELKIAHFKQKRKVPNLQIVVTGRDMDKMGFTLD